jgi:hypothetical protein
MFQLFARFALCFFLMDNASVMLQFVVCIGQDGHVEMEWANNNRCDGTENFPIPKAANLDAQQWDHCGDCLDVPLFSNQDGARIQSARFISPGYLGPSIPMSVHPQLSLLALTTYLKSRFPVHSVVFADSKLNSLQSVRLLI